MSQVIIKPNTERTGPKPEGPTNLYISEMFTDTLQGENFVGYPATFIRLKGCTLNCSFCDTESIWKSGNAYSFLEICNLMEQYNVIQKLKLGEHLIFTGGSPLLQQINIVRFIDFFIDKYDFKPYIEIENEAVHMPIPNLIIYVDLWNNSPKLSNSNVPKSYRYAPYVLRYMRGLANSWFKFVISDENDYKEIEADFISNGLIPKNQIVLMPEGKTRYELDRTIPLTVQMAISNSIRYSGRLHIDLWDNEKSV